MKFKIKAKKKISVIPQELVDLGFKLGSKKEQFMYRNTKDAYSLKTEKLTILVCYFSDAPCGITVGVKDQSISNQIHNLKIVQDSIITLELIKQILEIACVEIMTT